MMAGAVAVVEKKKKTKAVTHRQQSTKIGSGRNVGGGDGNIYDSGDNDDGNGDSGDDNNNDNDSGNGSSGGEEGKGGDTQTTIN